MSKRINPNLRKLAELTYDPDLEVDESMFEKQTSFQPIVPERKGMIYVPSVGIHIAKERSLCGLNWYKTHEKLHEQELIMPTIPQFIEFVKYLRNGYSNRKEAEGILDEILTVRSPWRAEWLDAEFSKEGKQMYINYNHRINSKGELEALNKEKLETCLMRDFHLEKIDLNSCNKQGLPTKKGDDINYWYPRKDCVAKFDAGSGGAGLFCEGGPSFYYSSLGVFGCCEAVCAENLEGVRK